ncbi:DUF3793 family protein [Dendrosporobacter sp. 1207_IL3150]|uniref:DUF3793 family protein n=1 Tax=Dendrosporobacter sp. 1207_IL3150 TaxID=3084054 RepID=UPI002FDAF4BA
MAKEAVILTHYNNEDFLSKWLALELAPTIFGSKPSTILSIVNTKSRPLLTLWRQYGPELLNGSSISFFILKETPDRLAILFYRRDMLEQCIYEPNNKEFLLSHGYPIDKGLDETLVYLKSKFTKTCPHDFGILLGIPLKDVLGFMGLSDQPLCCSGCWHIYGNPECSLAIMKRFDDDRYKAASWIEGGWEPYRVLSYREEKPEAMVS